MKINLHSLICPYFVTEGENKKEAIESFPGVFRFSIGRLVQDIEETRALGISKILLFGIPKKKDSSGSAAYRKGNIVSSAVRQIKAEFKDLVVMTDICLCSYTSHGHCGILKNRGGKIDNARTLAALAEIALSHARAGADWVAPSAMARGQVAAIRSALDRNGYRKAKILGYSAKFASNFYGPFRNAASSAPKFGDRSSYQLGFSSAKTALNEIKDDIREGADMVMVKPALSYLDIISKARSYFSHPLAAYNTSGEYAMIKYGAKFGLFDEKSMVFEAMTSIKRAGADFIITYHARDIAKWLRKKKG